MDPRSRPAEAAGSARRRYLIAGGIALGSIMVARLLDDPSAFPTAIEIDLRDPVNAIVDWITSTFATFTAAIKDGFTIYILNPLEDVLTSSPWWLVVAAVGIIGWAVSGLRAATVAGICLMFVILLGLWEHSMQTLASVLVATIVTLALGLLFGVLSARSDKTRATLRPLLDAAQTMPAFVYLIPAVALFGASRYTAIVASVIYAAPPVIRLVDAGIRSVSSTVMEAAIAAGSTERQLLWKVQLPLSRKAMLLAVNQGIVLVLAMVVVGGLVGAGALGFDVVAGFAQRSNFGIGLAAGASIVLLGIMLDRISQGAGGRPAKSTAGSEDTGTTIGRSSTHRDPLPEGDGRRNEEETMTANERDRPPHRGDRRGVAWPRAAAARPLAVGGRQCRSDQRCQHRCECRAKHGDRCDMHGGRRQGQRQADASTSGSAPRRTSPSSNACSSRWATTSTTDTLAEEVAWQGFETGEVDVILENWGHPDLEKTYITDKKVAQDAGPNGVTGLIHWYVPPWLAAEHPDITDWNNLNKYADQFKTSESGDQGQFLAQRPDVRARKDRAIIENLNLNFKVVDSGSEAASIAAFQQAEAQKTLLIGYFYDPQWLLAEIRSSRSSCRRTARGLRRLFGGRSGEIACDYPQYALNKIVATKFATNGGDAYTLVKNFSGRTPTRTRSPTTSTN